MMESHHHQSIWQTKRVDRRVGRTEGKPASEKPSPHPDLITLRGFADTARTEDVALLQHAQQEYPSVSQTEQIALQHDLAVVDGEIDDVLESLDTGYTEELEANCTSISRIIRILPSFFHTLRHDELTNQTIIREHYKYWYQMFKDEVKTMQFSSENDVQLFQMHVVDEMSRELPSLPPRTQQGIGEIFLHNSQDHTVMIHVLKTWNLDPHVRETHLLQVTTGKDDAKLLKDNADLFHHAHLYRSAEALQEGRMKDALESCWELNSASAMEVAEIICLRCPEMAGNLQPEIFSPLDRLAIAMRVARKNPDSFVKMLDTLDVTFTDDDRRMIAQDIATLHPESLNIIIHGLKLSHKMVEQILDDTTQLKDRARMLNSLEIPQADALSLKQGYGKTSRENNLTYSENIEKTVRETDRISQDLSRAVINAFPHRLTAERERTSIEQNMRRPIKTIGELGSRSANAPLAVTFDDKPFPSVYKPYKREPGVMDNRPQMRKGIHPGEGMAREWLAAQIDKALQLDVVPPTILRNGPEGIGSVQDWRVGRIAGIIRPKTADAQELMKIAVFDVVCLNSDRHDGNYLVAPDGSVQAIDNGYILSTIPEQPKEGLRSYPVEDVQGQPVPKEIRDKIFHLRHTPDVLEALHQAFQFTFQRDTPTIWKNFLTRLESLGPDDPTIETELPPVQWH